MGVKRGPIISASLLLRRCEKRLKYVCQNCPIPLQKSAKCQPLKESMAVLKFLLNKCIWQPLYRCPKLSQNNPKLSQKFSSLALIPCRKSRSYQQSSWSVFDQAKTLSFSAVINLFICCFITANCSFGLLMCYGCCFSDWVPLQVVLC